MVHCKQNYYSGNYFPIQYRGGVSKSTTTKDE